MRVRGVLLSQCCHSPESGNPEETVSKSLDARLRGNDIKNTPMTELFVNLGNLGSLQAQPPHQALLVDKEGIDLRLEGCGCF